MGHKINKWLNNSQFELQEARALRQMPSRSLQDSINTYYASIGKVLSELEVRFK